MPIPIKAACTSHTADAITAQAASGCKNAAARRVGDGPWRTTIATAANAVISRNADRMGKELWTAVKGGEPIRVYAAFNERDEADFVIDRLREHRARGLPLSAAAVLYRSNAQSRAFEEALMAARIPYRVYGGLRFFERAEIKDALSYLRLTQSRDDDIAFERAVNVVDHTIAGRIAVLNPLRRVVSVVVVHRKRRLQSIRRLQ